MLGNPEMREYKAVYVVGDEGISLLSHEIVVTCVRHEQVIAGIK
jgi:hypothetical protein